MATAADIQSQIDALELRIASFAGVRGIAFSDQSTQFSIDDAHKELARLKGLLVVANAAPRTRYAATSKGV